MLISRGEVLHATTCIHAAYNAPPPRVPSSEGYGVAGGYVYLKRGGATRNHMYPCCIPHAASARPLFRGVRRSRGVCFSSRGRATRNHMYPCCIPCAASARPLFRGVRRSRGVCFIYKDFIYLCWLRQRYTYPYPSKEGICYTQPHASMLHTLYIPLPL